MKCPMCDGRRTLFTREQPNVVTQFGEIKLVVCPTCNGTGEVKEKKQTNFQRITASPEALAEFICDISFYFPWDDSEFCCRYNIETEQDRLNFVRDWLNEESKE